MRRDLFGGKCEPFMIVRFTCHACKETWVVRIKRGRKSVACPECEAGVTEFVEIHSFDQLKGKR